jgi:2-iminobutanoate/2-iminopropanoate deaminase
VRNYGEMEVAVKQIIHTDKAPEPWGPWSVGIRAGDFVFVGGQGPVDPRTGKVKGSTIQEQTSLTLESMKAILEAGGYGMKDVVKVQVLLTDMSDFAGMNEVFTAFFSPPYPTRMTYGTALTAPGMKVEMDAIAYVGK